MTPAHTDSPLRRSEAGIFREGGNAPNVAFNDDDEERREARRRTLQNSSNESTSSGTFEENETLKKCLEIYNGNKLSKDNAWSLSLIDTLSTLLDRHHKSLNNFKVAGSSLEASSKVYSLRVDSIHMDVLRIAAGLNAQKFNERQVNDDDEDDNIAANDGDPNSSIAQGEAEGVSAPDSAPAAKKQKRTRKAVSTITKNKETLNARLDTVPLQDPVFGKLNTIAGSINSSSRLMNNILLTTDSELRLRTNFTFWDSRELPQCDFTEEVNFAEGEVAMAPCDRLLMVRCVEELQLRATHGGYVISDTPESIADEADKRLSLDSNASGDGGDGGGGGDGGDGFNDNFCNNAELSMAFDINAECEPLPDPGTVMAPPILDVDYAELQELTNEERTAINNCRGLRRAPVLIEDLRPVDANSKLEYSYRPLDKISQYWAGPSHWKFKRSRARGSTIHGQQVLSGTGQQNGRIVTQRSKRAAAILAKQRMKQLNFGEYHDHQFAKLDDKFKVRKVNVQKKWDQRKLKLPTDLQIDGQIFYKFTYAPMLSQGQRELQESATPLRSVDTDDEREMDGAPFDAEHFGDNEPLGTENLMQVSSMSGANGMLGAADEAEVDGVAGADNVDACNTTVLEIGTDFQGAPSQVTKIVVPYAKRAKVIDMKNLKRCCSVLLTKQMKRPMDEEKIPSHPIITNESYAQGMASFKEIYTQLPELLTPSMSEALSPSVAFYSVLHLANDLGLRLIPQEDLEDFKIRQVVL